MLRPTKIAALLVAATLVGLWMLTPATAQEENSAERKALILANLKLKFPKLEQMRVIMGDIEPTEFEGLDRGFFTMPGRGDQKFLVSRDNTKLYMISGDAIDVSLDEEQLQARVAEIEAEQARAAAERSAQLAAAVDGVPARGNPDAPVTIIEFSDFQCPYCAKGANTVQRVMDKYPDDVKFIFKHFPLGFHKWAKPAAIASNCAAAQSDDAFWLLHDKYFQEQRNLTVDNVLEKTRQYLAESGIDMAQWSTCAEDTESEAYKATAAAVDADTALGQQLGVSGTPGFFVNGHFLNGAVPINRFESIIEKAKSGT
jgi:protein-disulfide isomerase